MVRVRRKVRVRVRVKVRVGMLTENDEGPVDARNVNG